MAAQGADAVIARIIKLAKASIVESGKKVEGVGIGLARPTQHEDRRRAASRPTSAGRTLPLRDRVGEGLSLPAMLDNDANCAIFGEWWRGAARGAKYVIGLTLGTGIGGGIVIDGEIYHGVTDVAENRARHDRCQRTPLQMRQLRLHRGVRGRPGDRRARDRRDQSASTRHCHST